MVPSFPMPVGLRSQQLFVGVLAEGIGLPADVHLSPGNGYQQY